MAGWHHWLKGHEFEQTPGAGEGQGSLVCWSPWRYKELDTTSDETSIKDMEAMPMSADRGMDKEAAADVYNGILLSHEKGTGLHQL